MSRLKAKLVDEACQQAFNRQPGDGQRLLDQYGLKLMEDVLNRRGVYWFPAEKAWRFKTDAEKGAA